MKILEGKKIANKIETALKSEVLAWKKKGIVPGLAVILVGNDPASQLYVQHKETVSQKLGFYSEVYRLKTDTAEEEIINLIRKLNNKEAIHGILIQLPLPSQINTTKVIKSLNPQKDVDCFHPQNVGRLVISDGYFFPCTPMGIVELFKQYRIKIVGQEIVIVGASNIVGKPLALMLLNLGATVTICHDKTKNLKAKCLQADILISATGQAGLIKADMVKQGAVVVDVGMNREKDGKVRGDVEFPAVSLKASAITPVPGGVGPMTIAMLMKNTLKAVKQSRKNNLCS